MKKRKNTTLRDLVVVPSLLLGLLFLTVDLGTPMMRGVQAVEINVTREWQLLGENDTIPAGMHVRMDLSTGEKWVKQLVEDEDDDDDENNNINNVHVTTTTVTTATAQHSLSSSLAAVTVDPDGSVSPQETREHSSNNNNNDNDDDDTPRYHSYDFETMHRTLSKLPDQEMEKYGGLPEFPSRGGSTTTSTLTPQERQIFEARMAEIWEQRQAELKEAQEQLLDVPELLKDRMRGIKDYLKDPLGHLNSFHLDDEPEGGDVDDEDEDNGAITHILSLLKDLEFQLIDLDNARDFHTLGGWECLVRLLSEDAHVGPNQTLVSTTLSPSIHAKVRAVQAHAAWAIGTAVKNTEEFFPYAVEPVQGHGTTTTTALDMTIQVFCKEYNDEESGPIQTLLAKTIYAIGALLRGNRMAQARLVEIQGGLCLGQKLQQQLVDDRPDIKLVQRLISLASDLITDIQGGGNDDDDDAGSPDWKDESIVRAFTTPQWCQSVSSVLTSEPLLPVRIQETILEASRSMATHCSTSWKEKTEDHKAAVRRFWNSWEENKEDFDIEHLNQLKKQVTQLRQVL